MKKTNKGTNNKTEKVEKEDTIELQGVVVDIARNLIKVQLSEPKALEGRIVEAYPSGPMRKNNIRLILGDIVKLEASIYDITKSRIVWRGAEKEKTEKNTRR